MTVEEIKCKYTMRDVLAMYGIRPNRGGLISCPFHRGDHAPSMKIYPKDYHCFACGANGDIFTFVQNMDNCDFKAAFIRLGGTYEHEPENLHRQYVSTYKRKKQQETEQIRKAKLRQRIYDLSQNIEFYRLFIHILEPLSPLWCECFGKFINDLQMHEYLRQQMRG